MPGHAAAQATFAGGTGEPPEHKAAQSDTRAAGTRQGGGAGGQGTPSLSTKTL